MGSLKLMTYDLFEVIQIELFSSKKWQNNDQNSRGPIRLLRCS